MAVISDRACPLLGRVDTLIEVSVYRTTTELDSGLSDFYLHSPESLADAKRLDRHLIGCLGKRWKLLSCHSCSCKARSGGGTAEENEIHHKYSSYRPHRENPALGSPQ